MKMKTLFVLSCYTRKKILNLLNGALEKKQNSHMLIGANERLFFLFVETSKKKN